VSTVKVQLELPEALAHKLDPSGVEVGRRILELVLLRLVQDGEISSGKGAEVLGISKQEFRALLREHKIPYFNLTPEELRKELAASRQAEIHRST
jgi:predicted HTH domain antitoxin